MIRDGFIVYRDATGQLHLDMLHGGMITPLQPEPEDEKLQEGEYDIDMGYIGPLTTNA